MDFWIILIIFLLIWLIVDRVCECLENKANAKAVSKILKTLQDNTESIEDDE